MSRNAEQSLFARTGWLAETPAAFREAVLARCDRLAVAAGLALYKAGDVAGGLFGLVEGRINVHLMPRSDAPTLFHIAGPGFWTGEFAAATGERRLIALTTRTDCRVLRLSRAELHRVAAEVPECWQMVSGLAARNNISTLRALEALKREDATERVALTLVNLAREVTGPPVMIDVSQAELGDLARMSRGTVNAALRVLSGRGLIVQEYGAIRVPDVAALESFSLAG